MISRAVFNAKQGMDQITSKRKEPCKIVTELIIHIQSNIPIELRNIAKKKKKTQKNKNGYSRGDL